MSVAECAKLRRENSRLKCLIHDHFLQNIIPHDDDNDENGNEQKESEQYEEKSESGLLYNVPKKKTIKELESIEGHLRSALQCASLEKEKEARRIIEEEEEDKRCCVICQTEPKTILLMPCRHLCVCAECGRRPELDRCPLCREIVRQKISVFS
mmetsp:Transcript_22187/g.32659  ORF Transcript_22187/g.32659 Transcript_22187/m.32659 type:complete len:154 (-) Transcript_22187:540-1001(-)